MANKDNPVQYEMLRNYEVAVMRIAEARSPKIAAGLQTEKALDPHKYYETIKSMMLFHARINKNNRS